MKCFILLILAALLVGCGTIPINPDGTLSPSTLEDVRRYEIMAVGALAAIELTQPVMNQYAIDLALTADPWQRTAIEAALAAANLYMDRQRQQATTYLEAIQAIQQPPTEAHWQEYLLKVQRQVDARVQEAKEIEIDGTITDE